MHAKYEVAIFNIAKVLANVKVGANQQTNRQGKNNMSPTIVVGDIKAEDVQSYKAVLGIARKHEPPAICQWELNPTTIKRNSDKDKE
ncbi:hypothetical protein DPMN_192512 [Dreissena polymorpha]|uniref:Uncharacterized protein n=1 Tax=Dreissena polymorpha TaxID=45954 RepID=A0A9D3Y6F3_DREPO|nr:hypothetical protein DPMN_192512 [Dreissena polymorpha]